MNLVKLYRSFLKKGVEPLLVKTVGKYLWPPCSVAVLVEGDHEDILTLDVDKHHRLPGGLIEGGEDPKTSAKREVKEETGFEVEIEELLDVRTSSEESPGITFFFRAEVIKGDRNGSWEGEPKFIEKEEISEKVWKLEHSHISEYLFPEV